MNHHRLATVVTLLVIGLCGASAYGDRPRMPTIPPLPVSDQAKGQNSPDGRPRLQHKVEIDSGSHWGWKVAFGVLFTGAVILQIRDTRRKAREAGKG